MNPAVRQPELCLDGTNNASERAIVKSKVSYKAMRDYKSMEGMNNAAVLTQWPYSREAGHFLVAVMAV